MSRIPKDPPPAVETKKDNKTITQVREYKLITPLFGGGVVPAEADPVTVIRGTEIRGHLRFWWRATRGGRFGGDLAKMKAAEDELWGAASTPQKPSPSKVQIGIELTDRGRPFVVRDRHGNIVDISHFRSDYSYVAFPLDSKQSVCKGVRFKLSLTYPKDEEMRKDLEAALWAWETFGGIGARTRRGFGALQCLSVTVDGEKQSIAPPTTDNAAKAIEDGLVEHVLEGQGPKNVPQLVRKSRFKVIDNSFSDALAAWRDLIWALQNFRQHRPEGRFGRSDWPEADEIRRRTGQSLPKYKNSPVSNVRKFPRAVFGLPIVFHFIDADENLPGNPDADPREISLQGRPFKKGDEEERYDRLASSLILRPLACAQGKAVGLAAILDAPPLPPRGLILSGIPPDPMDPIKARLEPDEAKELAQRIEPLATKKTDILQAFLDTL